MKITKKIMVTVIMLASVLMGCNAQETTAAVAFAQQLKAEVPVFAELTTGPVSFDSVQAYYNDTASKWQEILAQDPPERFRKGIEAQKNIAVILNTLLRANANTIDISYLGRTNEENSDVFGIFFYDLSDVDSSLLTAQMLSDANDFTFDSEAGEYFHKAGNYMITCMHGLLEDYQSLFDKIDTLGVD